VGFDPGQANDYAALAVLERRDPPGAGPDVTRPSHYAVRHLGRWPLGTAYPKVVADVARLVRALPANPVLAVDATGVGRPVVDLLHQERLSASIYPITITGGLGVTAGQIGPNVPKRDLVSTLQVLLQTRRLKIARGLAEARTLVEELSLFQVKLTVAAHETFGPGKERAHDDLVLATALAAWLAENRPEPNTGSLIVWPPGDQAEAEPTRASFLDEVYARMDREDEASDSWR
jgi:hypothetical protein